MLLAQIKLVIIRSHFLEHSESSQKLIIFLKVLKIEKIAKFFLTEKWKPTQDQQLGTISRVFDFFIDELDELQEELACYKKNQRRDVIR